MAQTATEDLAHIRALLFDLGGVVFQIDFERAVAIWAERASCDPTCLRTRFAFDDAYEDHERGTLDASAYFAALRLSLGVALTDDDLRAGWNGIYLGPVPGMASILRTARSRFPLYAFTNSNPTHQKVWSIRFASDLAVFRTVFVSSDIGLRKPDPEAFMAVANLAGFEPSAFLFFDDSEENIEGARTAGMSAVLVESPSDVRRSVEQLGIDTQ
jgi:FMN phosphatase YigB (HAD superfamily)